MKTKAASRGSSGLVRHFLLLPTGEPQERGKRITEPHDERRQPFDLPPEAEKHLVWYGFIKRLPTTIFWLSLWYALGFILLTLGFWIEKKDLTGKWLWLYYVGGMDFIAGLLPGG